MTPKGHGIIRGHSDLLYVPKSHGDLCGRFDLVYDLKRSRGHYRSPVTYFMTQKITVTFVVGLTYCMTPKGQRVIRGRRDLHYDPKGHGDLCGRFDLVYDLKRSRGH